jgi:transposase InsO family protein
MGSVGDCYDDAMCESFFATLECELLKQQRFTSQAEARMAVFDFIEGWYNPHRRHQGLESAVIYQFRKITSSWAYGQRPISLHQGGTTPN